MISINNEIYKNFGGSVEIYIDVEDLIDIQFM